MDFGKLHNVDRVDFKLPSEDPRNPRWSGKPFRLSFGFPVWGQKKWVGSFYPPGTGSKDYLTAYATQVSAIELNTSFYRIPDDATVRHWREVTPANFRFCPKIFQGISHNGAITAHRDLLKQFTAAVMRLDDRLGVSFLQLPPFFEVAHLPVLETFLKMLPVGFPLAVEFRHPSWFAGGALVVEAFELMQRYGVAPVITDVAGRRDVSHSSLPVPRVMVRFVCNELQASDYLRCEQWAERLAAWKARGVEEVYFFIHQPGDVTAPEILSYWIKQVNASCGLNLPDWKRHDEPKQMSLFG